ncbi:tumor necrosis factor receptor superfamily member 9-like [Clinocottus analis]|uniref:tumor necrosis factor receptor superfamily member 9-like n=1 Tax=Clinocottus analis TaxID=304258 RepID=UPI0035BF31C6
MAAIFWATGLSLQLLLLLLLLQGCCCNAGQTDTGCRKWTQREENICCEACHPGHHMGIKCGLRPKDLCIPCEAGTFSNDPQSNRCARCSQCVGAQVYVKHCTGTTDAQCGCKEGLTCGDLRCSFCVKRCPKGQEPAEKRSCRPCPAGTFNDQTHQMCKPWSNKCPNPEQVIVVKGDALSDIKCANVSVGSVRNADPTEKSRTLVSSVITSVVLMAFGLIVTIIIVTITVIMAKKRKAGAEKPIPKTPIIRTPTDDDPRTLIAIECSFHEAEQEQGSSTESLASKESLQQLIV